MPRIRRDVHGIEWLPADAFLNA
jgi:hypothetical protein